MKNKTLIKTLSAFLAVVMLLCSAPLSGFVGLKFPELNLPEWFDFSMKAEAATEYTSGIYTYTISNGEATIIECDTSVSGAITIPSTLGGYPVTSIGTCAFAYITDSRITTLSIPDSIKSIAYNAFCCLLIDEYIVDEGNPCYSSSGGVLYDENKTMLVKYPSEKPDTNFKIPNSVTSIADDAFCCCNLTSIVIPDNVTSIGDGAFEWCSSLASIEIGSGVKQIGECAFTLCAFTTVIIPDNVISIEDFAFEMCYDLVSIEIGSGVTRIGDNAFIDTEKLIDVYYSGTEAKWNKIDFGSGNEYLTSATIHYNSTYPDKDGSEQVVPTINFGSDKNTFGEDISGYVGDEIDTLLVYTSAENDASSLTITSSKTSVVEIGTVEIGVGDYISGENEHSATVQLNLKAKGTATITVRSPEGVSESITVTVEEKDKSIVVLSTEKSFTVKTGESMWLAFGMMVDGKLDGEWKEMSVTVSDPTIVSLSGYEKTEYGYSLKVIGKKEGATNLTITDTETGISTSIIVSVFDDYSKSYSYAINDIATFYPSNNWEDHIATNIYDLNGLYVNNYSCSKSGSAYYISFDVYNQRYHFGAIDVYDANGNWIGSEAIEKYSDISSLYDTGEQIIYMVIDATTGSWLTYEQAMLSKKTTINIKVPEGGYFTISNNFVESQGAFIYNVSDILINGLTTFFDVSSSIGNLKSLKPADLGKTIVDELFKDPNVTEAWMDVFKDVICQQVTETVKDYSTNDIDAVCSEITNVFENSLNKVKVDWKDAVKSSAGLAESAFQEFAGPAGIALEACFSISNATNTIIQIRHLTTSIDEAYVTIYSSIDEGYINQHGVVVNTNGNMDAEAVLQVFRISNDDSVEVLLDSDNPLESHELYNICFVKNDKLVQPNGKVKVYVPVPEGMSGNTCVIYRQETDGFWTILDAKVEGSYLVFETDHFSLYAIIGEKDKLTINTLPNKLVYTRNDVLDTTGLVLKLNGETITEGYYCDPTLMYEYGTQKITVKYGKATAEFEVDVLEPSENITDITVVVRKSNGEVVLEEVISDGVTEYNLHGVEDGEYTFTILKETYATRQYTVTVIDGSISVSFELNKLGDITGDGKVNTIDVARANSCAKKVSTLSEYEFACADVNGDGKVNTVDVARMNAHAKSVSFLW